MLGFAYAWAAKKIEQKTTVKMHDEKKEREQERVIRKWKSCVFLADYSIEELLPTLQVYACVDCLCKCMV